MPYKLIVADSSPSILKTLQMVFPEDEYEIYPFRDGIEVEKALSQLSPDAILINLSLPHKDGYEICRYLNSHEKFKQIPLILLKGAFDVLDKKRISDLEYNEIVQEPFDSAKLAMKVRGIIATENDPQTLPEDPVLDEDAGMGLKEDIDERVKDLVKKEILGLEEKLEKKISSRIAEEINRCLNKIEKTGKKLRG